MDQIIDIFCDDSGTSSNLLDNQPFFVYSALALPQEIADGLVDKVRKGKFDFQGNELKGKNLLGSTQGREAILYILKELEGSYLLVFHDKKFALACKYFEYVFEPILADKSIFFYDVGFHKFIANIVHQAFINKTENAEELYNLFYTSLKTGNANGIFNPIALPNDHDNELWLKVIKFTIINKSKVIENIESSRKNVGEWILDLTITSLFSLLNELGADDDVLKVHCDNSRILEKTNQESFNLLMSSRSPKKTSIGNSIFNLGFRLSEPIIFQKSTSNKGIQLADIISSSLNYALRNKEEDFSKEILHFTFQTNAVSRNSILPDSSHIDYSKESTMKNMEILDLLIKYSEEGKDVIENFDSFLQQLFK